MALIDLQGPMIAPGESLSAPLECRGATILRVTMPSNWSHANLTFQIASTAAGPWGDLFTRDGKEHIIPVRRGATMFVNQPPGPLSALAFIRFRSGRRDKPVPQEGGEPRIFVTTIDDGQEAAPVEPAATPPSVVDVPAVMVGGNIVPTCAVGNTLTCTVGNWNGEPSAYWQSWLVDSVVVGAGNSYTAQPEDAGKRISCSVTATNDAGSANVISNAVTVDAA